MRGVGAHLASVLLFAPACGDSQQARINRAGWSGFLMTLVPFLTPAVRSACRHTGIRATAEGIGPSLPPFRTYFSRHLAIFGHELPCDPQP